MEGAIVIGTAKPLGRSQLIDKVALIRDRVGRGYCIGCLLPEESSRLIHLESDVIQYAP
jgi:hypothetical protein